jgi:serine protease Do
MRLCYSEIAAAIIGLVTLSGAAHANHEESAAALSIDRSIDVVKGWTMGASGNFGGCWIKATYNDQTTVWMGYSGGDRDSYIAFTNPKWRSIEPGKSYSLTVGARGGGKWTASFMGVEADGVKGVFGGPLKDDFVNDMARASGISVFLGQQPVAQLTLTGSAAALTAALECHKVYLEVRNESRGGVTESNNEDGSAPVARRSAPKGNEGAGSSGTGFFVTARGHVMTNHHVIEKCTNVQVIPAGSPPVKASVLAKDSVNDLAVLRTSYEPDGIAVINPRVRIGDSIYIYGFPLSGILASTGNFTIGNVTATAGLEDDTRMMQISAPVQPGNSGGSLVDQYGNTVGVIVSKLNVLNIAKLTGGDLPQNVNFAIKASVALNFLESNGITATTMAKSVAKDAASIAEEAKMFTVKVVCM